MKKGSIVASRKLVVSGLSGRYAIALFDLAVEKKALKDVAGDVDVLTKMLAESDDLQRLVTSPIISRKDQGAAVAALAEKAKLQALTANFLGALAANRRLSALSRVLSDFSRLLADYNGEVSADVISARALTKTQTTALTKKLKAAVGRDVTVNASTDESLIGGLVVKMGSRMVDASVKTKLDNLKVAMKGVQ